MTGGLWLPPAKNSIVFGLPDVLAGKNNAKVMFSQADIASSTLGAATGSIVQPLRLTTTGTVVVPAGAVVNPAGATLALNFATGTFSGTFSLKDPNPLNTKQIIVRSNSFYGALVPRLNQGQGYFLLNQLPKVAGDTSTNTPTLSGLVTLQGLVP